MRRINHEKNEDIAVIMHAIFYYNRMSKQLGKTGKWKGN